MNELNYNYLEDKCNYFTLLFIKSDRNVQKIIIILVNNNNSNSKYVQNKIVNPDGLKYGKLSVLLLVKLGLEPKEIWIIDLQNFFRVTLKEE